MAASDFFENFLLHDGVKSLHANENLSIVPLVSSRDATTGGYSADRGSSFLSVGPWWACLCPPVGALLRPRHCQALLCGNAPLPARKQRVPCTLFSQPRSRRNGFLELFPLDMLVCFQ